MEEAHKQKTNVSSQGKASFSPAIPTTTTTTSLFSQKLSKSREKKEEEGMYYFYHHLFLKLFSLPLVLLQAHTITQTEREKSLTRENVRKPREIEKKCKYLVFSLSSPSSSPSSSELSALTEPT